MQTHEFSTKLNHSACACSLLPVRHAFCLWLFFLAWFSFFWCYFFFHDPILFCIGSLFIIGHYGHDLWSEIVGGIVYERARTVRMINKYMLFSPCLDAFKFIYIDGFQIGRLACQWPEKRMKKKKNGPVTRLKKSTCVFSVSKNYE